MKGLWLGAILGSILMLTVAATVSRVTTWSDGQVLTAATLNGEFDNIVTNINNLNEDNISSSATIPVTNIGVRTIDTSLDSGIVGKGSVKSGTETSTTTQYVVSSLSATVGAGVVQLTTGIQNNPTLPAMPNCTIPDGDAILFGLYRDSTVIYISGIENSSGSSQDYSLPTSVTYDQPGAGSYTYEWRVTHTSTSVSCVYAENALWAVEL